jgi:acetyl esterase/lipase
LPDRDARGSGDKSNHGALARRLAALSGSPVAVLNYRLTAPSTPLLHPEHAADVLSALVFLTSHWPGPVAPDSHTPALPYDPGAFYAVGHSCGAHILSALALDSSAHTPVLAPPPPAPGRAGLITAIRGVVCSEGIFDLDALLASFPTYHAWFIANAFGPGPSYAAANVAAYPRRVDGSHIRWLLVHSSGDTLVDVRQARAMYDHLRALYGDEVTNDAKDVSPMITLDTQTFTQGHDDVLAEENYAEMICDFVQRDVR